MEILKTKNYDAFKSITCNREVDKAHVKKLAKSIANKNLMQLNPIIVDEDMNVIDGQHRLEACRSLDIDVCCVISNKIKQDDLRILNSVQKSWSMMDYINYYTVAGVQEFIELSKLMNQYPKMHVSVITALVTTWSRDNDLRNGKLRIDNLDNARKICEIVMHISTIVVDQPFVFSTTLVAALRKCYENEEFDWEIFYKKIENQQRSFVKCSSKNEYLKMFEELYNRWSSKNLIDLTSRKAA